MLTNLDWIVIIGFLLLILIVGISYTRSSGKNMESFFLGGRNLPWWLAGLSMVATTFAADTPLAVTELVGQNGIAGNWLWWNLLAGGMLTTFFFAKLWQRSGVLTEVEFIELRYSGRPARFLRGFKSIYLGLFMNVMVIGWVNVAMTTLLQVFFDLEPTTALLWTGGLMLLVAIYSSLAGLMGVAVTDAIQFVIAMVSCILLAYFVIASPEIGGISGLKKQVTDLDPAALNFLPSISGDGASIGKSLSLSLSAFIGYIGILWWASWYPGAEPGGGGYIAQRMMSTRSEKDAFGATLFFQIAHYCVRPWPWILVGLAAITLYSVPRNISDANLKSQVMEIKAEGQGDKVFTLSTEELNKLAAKDPAVAKLQPQIQEVNQALAAKAANDPRLETAMEYAASPKNGFVFAMRDYLPAGLLGLLLVAFFAAYMSTISTQLNWGAGYLVNDLYKRFLKRDESDGHYVWVSRLTTILLAIIGIGVSAFINHISGAWQFIMQCGAGLGLVLILRWYWWRVNAWSEIAAMVAPIIVSIPFFIFETPFEEALPITVLFTTIVWLLVTIFSKPTDMETLKRFYERVQPGGDWSVISQEHNNKVVGKLGLQWLLAIVFTYSVLFLIGNLVLLNLTYAGILFVLSLGSGLLLRKLMD